MNEQWYFYLTYSALETLAFPPGKWLWVLEPGSQHGLPCLALPHFLALIFLRALRSYFCLLLESAKAQRSTGDYL